MIVDIRILLLVCCLFYESFSLRLLKVSIPAFKLRGESAFLECQYELDPPPGGKHTHNRHHHHHQEQHIQQGGRLGQDMNYIDSTDNENVGLQRTRNYPYTRQQQQQQPSTQQNQYQRRRISREDKNSVSASSSYYQSQRYEQETEEAHQQPQPIQKSPYGHSVYRGSSTSLFNNGQGYVGASTYRKDETTFEDSAESEHDTDDDENVAEDDFDEQEEGEALYAIKWYKDNEEFYRYVPKANPPKTSYRVDGVRVIEEHSDSSRVLLRGLTLNSTGLYRCEVSAEAPNFSSVQGEGRMDIVYLPRDGPHIKGQQFQYQIGETLNLNCTSGKSHPASHLQWFINDQPVLDERYLVRYNDTVHKHGIITSTLGLQLTVDGRHFYNGAMRVKCLASISPVLWKGDRESVLQRRPGIIDNREAMLLVRSSALSVHSWGQRWQHLGITLTITAAALLKTFCQFLLRTALT